MIKSRDELIDVIWQAIDNKNDIDVSLYDFAVAALEGIEAAGVVPVPVEATEAMIAESYRKTLYDANVPYGKIINAAFAASPFRRKK